MNLFHETENKYYELLSYMLNDKQSYSVKDITDYLNINFIGEIDYEVIDALFSNNEGEETVFSCVDNSYEPVIERAFPIRINQVELQALKSLVRNRYAKHFMTNETIIKLNTICSKDETIWDINEIQIKNQYQDGDIDAHKSYENKLGVIADAIKRRREIIYDNILEGKYKYIGKHAFPIRIEYSYINDMFRVSVFDPKKARFVKLNLATLQNVRLGNETDETLEEKYQEFLSEHTKSIELDVEPIDHVIERCFRIFSYYDRQARYDAEESKYKLIIKYLKQDENEVIRDIMSLGSYIVVKSPKRIQKDIYQRILAARDMYRD